MNSHLAKEIEASKLLQKCLEEGASGKSLLFEGLFPTAKAALLSFLVQKTGKSLLVLTGTGHEEFKLYNDLPFFSDTPVIEIASWETLPSEKIAPSPDIVASRLESFRTLATNKGPFLILSSLQAALQKVALPESSKASFFSLRIGEKIPFETLFLRLQAMGYEKKGQVTDKGEFAVRGGIIDLFPPNSKEAFRVEFWEDCIDSIRTFDPVSQKSVSPRDILEASNAKEELSGPLTTIFGYAQDSIIVFDDLEALEDRYASLTSLGGIASSTFLGIEELLDITEHRQRIFLSTKPIEQLSHIVIDRKSGTIEFEMFLRKISSLRMVHPFDQVSTFLARENLLEEEPVGEEMLDLLRNVPEHEVFFLCQNESEQQLLYKKLEAKKMQAHPKHHFISGYLSQGFSLVDSQTLVFSVGEMTGRIKVRRERLRTYYQTTMHEAFDISPGEAVVHYHHGIGKFCGVANRPNYQGIEEEYFLIEYADHAKLYVPLIQAHLISKYVGAQGTGQETHLKFHTLGSNRWKKQREETEKSIVGYASDLLKLYAERQIQGGVAFPEDGLDTKAFEEEFPYIETEDQLLAIRKVKEDMCSQKAMDRLICGDVGYGKTEVAMRAAFKAVLDGGKQVAMLVPTTVLTLQHYENFRDRMEGFGIRTEMLSRFCSTKEIKKTLEDLEDGKVDIVVGTHRLLQKDVHFKTLGLIIIDEEQRFGVKAKEHLKLLKRGVDCMTLSATPIPRTLYMSLVGARDLSIINTPPQDRLPIKTIITDPDEQIIQIALTRELNRDGQAFFIHNRIETIYEKAAMLRRLLPKASIAIGHGQMDPKEIDLVFHAFKKGEVDILVATSIVESGIDIPNANTIIIDNADHFGIADLYQLRGRVGRWNRRAFAYFLIPKRRELSEISRKRLEAIAQAGSYGGGMRVAMRDLELRGAGDILGLKQSGLVCQVGFHLYCKLLKRTIDSLQGKAPSWTLETKIESSFDARIPESYVGDVQLRMEFYQRLGEALSLSEVDALWEELKDRFGKPPLPARWLYHVTRLKVFAQERGFTRIKIENSSVLYEKKTGNSSFENRSLLPKITSPEELEKKIWPLLIKKDG